MADGHGQGVGASYKPWLRVQSFSSKGVSNRPFSIKTGRHHELFSNVELAIFLALDWQQDVVDIREQYPLDRDLSRTIADQLGIRHPHYPDTQVPTVMTVDFLVTRRSHGVERLEAYNAKPEAEAENHQSIAKLEIQRSYFALLEIPHHLVFETDIPERPISNLTWISDALSRDKAKEQYVGYWDEMSEQFGDFLGDEMHRSTTLADICKQFDSRTGKTAGTGLRAARILLAKHVLVPDLNSPDIRTAPLTSFKLNGSTANLYMVGGRK